MNHQVRTALRLTLSRRQQLEVARRPTIWDPGNQVLYDLCSAHPAHDEEQYIASKIWLIGRAYAAAIERRRKCLQMDNDAFYARNVARFIKSKHIDRWISKAARHRSINSESLSDILETHSTLTALFKKISGIEKRSLASKYLHFHFPALFFIYDTRAVKALGQLIGRMKQASVSTAHDPEYARFVGKCLSLRAQLDNTLTPRQIDSLLLAIHAQTGH